MDHSHVQSLAPTFPLNQQLSHKFPSPHPQFTSLPKIKTAPSAHPLFTCFHKIEIAPLISSAAQEFSETQEGNKVFAMLCFAHLITVLFYQCNQITAALSFTDQLRH